MCPSLVAIDPGGACFAVTPDDKRVTQIKVVDDLGEPILGAWDISIEAPFNPDERYWFCGTWTGDILLPENANYVKVMLYSALPGEDLVPLPDWWETEPTPPGCSAVGPTTGEVTITFGS